MIKVTLADLKDFLDHYERMEADLQRKEEALQKADQFLENLDGLLIDESIRETMKKMGLPLDGKSLSERAEFVLGSYKRMADEYLQIKTPTKLTALKRRYGGIGMVVGIAVGVAATFLGPRLYSSIVRYDAVASRDGGGSDQEAAPAVPPPDGKVIHDDPAPETPKKEPVVETIAVKVKSPAPQVLKPMLDIRSEKEPIDIFNIPTAGSERKKAGKAYAFPKAGVSLDVYLKNFSKKPKEISVPEIGTLSINEVGEGPGRHYQITGALHLADASYCNADNTICGTLYIINIESRDPKAKREIPLLITQ